MKRKFLVILLALASALCLVFGLSACAGIGGIEGGGSQTPTPQDYAVTFDANGGVFADGQSTFTQQVVAGEKLTAPQSPTRQNYAFVGWAKSQDGTEMWKFDADAVSANVTLWAKWDKALSYTLSGDGSHYIVTGIGMLTGEVEVPAEYADLPVREIAESAFENCTSLTAITVGENVEKIGEKAFYNCPALTNVVLGEQVKAIPKDTFGKCGNLGAVTISPSVKSIAQNAFADCAELNRIDYTGTVSDWAAIDFWYSAVSGAYSTSNPLYAAGTAQRERTLYIDGEAVTSAELQSDEVKPLAFFGYKKLESVSVGQEVQVIGEGAFYNCKALESATFDGAGKLYSIGKNAFCGCSALGAIELPDHVKELGANAFYSCGLQTADLGSVAEIGESAFQQCKQLSSLTLGDPLARIGEYAFSYCDALTNVMIPKNVYFIGKYAFEATRLTSVVFENPNGWRVNQGVGTTYYVNIEGLGDAAAAARLLITLPNAGYCGYHWERSSLGLGFSLNSDRASYSVWIGNCGDKYIVIPAEYQGYPVTRIGYGAFEDCSSLQSIVIPESVTSIESSAFSGCRSLESIVIPESVTSIESSAFSGCRSLTSVTIPAGVTSIGYAAFNVCSSLESIVIPESVTSIGSSAFYGCSSLQNVTLEGDSKLTSIGYEAFYGCSSLASIIIPAGVTSIGERRSGIAIN